MYTYERLKDLREDADLTQRQLAEILGMHTTTYAEMYEVENGRIIDIPGIKGFGIIDMEAHEIGHYFPEIFQFSKECRFDDCLHQNEPDCAVRKALQEHKISESRYQRYLSILADISTGKYR